MHNSAKFRYLSGVSSLALQEDRCRGCGACLEVCPRQVLARQPQTTEATAPIKICIADKDACIECGACARNCPHKALTLKPGAGCATLILQQWAAQYGWKRKGASGCC